MLANLLLAALLSTAPDTVYVSPMGTHYHLRSHRCENCSPVLRLDAEAAGYQACKVCLSGRPKKSRPWDRLRGVK